MLRSHLWMMSILILYGLDRNAWYIQTNDYYRQIKKKYNLKKNDCNRRLKIQSWL